MTKNCTACGIEIPAGRVKALPNTNTCVEHSTTATWKINVITVGNIEKDDHYQEVEIIKDPTVYEELQSMKRNQGNYSKQ